MSLNVFDQFDHHQSGDQIDGKRQESLRLIFTAFYLKVLYFNSISNGKY